MQRWRLCSMLRKSPPRNEISLEDFGEVEEGESVMQGSWPALGHVRCQVILTDVPFRQPRPEVEIMCL
jgi:hypothetical protein